MKVQSTVNLDDIVKLPAVLEFLRTKGVNAPNLPSGAKIELLIDNRIIDPVKACVRIEWDV